MEVKKRPRRPNFSENDLMLLLKLLESHREVISCKMIKIYKIIYKLTRFLLLDDSELYGDELNKAWENLASEFSAQTCIARSGEEIRNKFKDLKSRTKKKIAEINSYQKGTGGAPPKVLSDVEKLVEKLAGENAMSGFNYYADSFSENPIVMVAEEEDDQLVVLDGEESNPGTTNAGPPITQTQQSGGPSKSKIKAVGRFKKTMRKKMEKSRARKKELNSKNDQIDQELLKVYKEKLEVSKEKLAVMKEALAVSKERLAAAKEFLEIAKNNGKSTNSQLNEIFFEEEYLVE